MGQYTSGLTDLIQLLKGGMDPTMGLQMFQGIESQHDEQQAQRKAQQQQLLGSLGETAMAEAAGGMAGGDVLQSIMAQQQFTGQEVAPRYEDNLIQGIQALYPQGMDSQSALYQPDPAQQQEATAAAFDEADQQAVVSQAQMAFDQGLDRKTFREGLRNRYIQLLGPEMQAMMDPQLDFAIDTAWGAASGEIPGMKPEPQQQDPLMDVVQKTGTGSFRGGYSQGSPGRYTF